MKVMFEIKEISMSDSRYRRSAILAALLVLSANAVTDAFAQEGWAIINRNSEENDKAVRRAPRRTQSPVLVASLKSLSEGSLKERIRALKSRVTSELVFVPGGDFMMGDYGTVWPATKRHLNTRMDSKPVHKVNLSAYSLSRYRTTFAEYDVFTEATVRQRYTNTYDDIDYRHPALPVGIAWHQAKDYCRWLGKITGLPFDLPTEAQWEYAARNRGGFVMFATDDGNIDPGRNVPTSKQTGEGPESLRIDVGGLFPTSVYPIGLFPSTPLGLYDMASNGYDWIDDWYAADYYAHSPKQDPKGPANGLDKVARGFPNGPSYDTGQTINRFKMAPDFDLRGKDSILTHAPADQYGIRCAVNSPKAVKPQG
jgi:formylglycine-generating enzyme required for sulfatase activity